MNEMTNEMRQKGITGSTLKLIAIITMFIDHFAAAILTRILIQRGYYEVYAGTDTAAMYEFSQQNAGLILVMTVMRMIGRLAFPIFCFLLVEGFYHTRNAKKYAGRLAIFAVITEIPFDLAFAGTSFYFEYQSVMVTLLIGLLVLVGLSFIKKKELNRVASVACSVLVIAIGMIVAVLLKTDYSWSGVACIVVFYLLRSKKVLRGFAGIIPLAISSLMEIVAWIDIPLIANYNGKRGWNMKYFFYAFYPVHLFILWLVCYFMGMGGINVM